MPTKQDLAYRHIRDRILDGTFLPGQRLLPNEIARAIGTSPVPVREALLRLRSERLVTITPHVGAVVALVTNREIGQTMSVVSVLEGYATRLAHASAAEIRPKLSAIQEEMRVACGREDWDRFSHLNRRFHEVIHAASGNPTLSAAIRSLWIQLDTFMSTTSFYLIPERARGSLAEHDEILGHFREAATDLERLERLARDHGMKTVEMLDNVPKVLAGA